MTGFSGRPLAFSVSADLGQPFQVAVDVSTQPFGKVAPGDLDGRLDRRLDEPDVRPAGDRPHVGILSVVRDFETGDGVNQERVWRIVVDVTRLVCGEATDGFGWSCV